MFEDILDYGKEKDVIGVLTDDTALNDEVCPNCGSDNVGSTASRLNIQMFCVDCGHIWEW